MICPNSTASGCRCPDHHPGLLATAKTDPVGLAAALDRIAGKPTATLRVLTTDPAPENLIPLPSDPKPCDGSMCCVCKACEKERATRVRSGVRPVRQPWEARKAA